jgi:pimeloyl-ACP methyl ester carboxylesterase
MRFDSTSWRLIQFGGILLAIGGLLLGMFFLIGHSIIYHPHPYTAGYRKFYPPATAELRFKSAAGRQTAFYVPPPRANRPPERIWVAFCGNGSLALDWLPLTTRDQNPGDAFLLIDYPGYGKSEGWPNPANTRAAANDAVKALASYLRMTEASLEPKFSVIGHSLGAAAALDFAARHQVREVILLAPFTSQRDEAATFIGRPLTCLLPNDYDNRAALRSLSQRHPPPRVFIFHGVEDELIPPQMGAELAREFPSLVTFRGLKDATHDTVVAAAMDEILSEMNQMTAGEQ